MAIRTERVEFAGSQGGALAARLDRPRGPVRAWALFAHCFSCSKDTLAATGIARRLAERGIGVLRFDFTGLGHSEGEFANTGFSSNVEDIARAADWLRAQRGPPEILIGHSFGGAACLVAARRIPDARAVATIGAPADAEHVRAHLGEAADRIEREGEAVVEIGGRAFKLGRAFLDDLARHDVEAAASGLGRALLVCHGPLDEVVGVDHATRIFLAARHPKSFLSLDRADHLLTDRADAHHAADVVAAWASRYASGSQIEEAPKPDEPRGVVVRETRTGKFMCHAVAGDHAFLVDEPESVGGDDAGPDPYQLVTAGLGACTAMTLRLYADRKGLALDRVTVRLAHAKEHAQDCEDCADGKENARMDVISRVIALEGRLSDENRAKLLEIAEKCPVHRTLEAGVVIRTAAKIEPAT